MQFLIGYAVQQDFFIQETRMSRKKIAKTLLSVLVVVSTLVSVVVDWNASHVFNPDWHPHGRFHDVMLLTLLVAFIPILLWLLWRKSKEPEVAVKVTTAILVTFWGSFYINLLIPGTSPAANVEELPPSLLGIPLYPNMVVAAIIIVLSLIGYWLYQSSNSTGEIQ